MQIKNINVKNFRSILHESLPCDSLTALVGRNGSGKSSFLSALEIFYDPSAKVIPEDFFAQDTTKDIEIAVTYGDLSLEEKERFSGYMENGTLTVARVFSASQAGAKSGTYHGARLQIPDFVEIRNAGGAMKVRSKYNDIRQKETYSSLPTANSEAAVRVELRKWEEQHPEQCVRIRDDGQFFGFTQVAQGYLGKHTKFIYVPAVRDASQDATEKRGSLITEITDLVVRNALANRQDITVFKQHTQDQYREIMNPEKMPELVRLASDLSNTLQSLVPGAEVLLNWSELVDIQIPMPLAEVKLLEDEYESRVERTGHGLQRAFIITLLQHLSSAQNIENQNDASAEKGEDETEQISVELLPSLILAIEEPELYQHPSRQRHLGSVFLNLATGAIPGVAEKTQIIYTTHSPLLVGLDRFDQIRVLRRIPHEGGPKITKLEKADMEAVARELWEIGDQSGDVFTADSLKPRLRCLMTPWMGEGFFADVVALVEGESDRAALLAVAETMGLDFDSLGIAVIPCFSKSSIDRPLVIFRQLGIPVYAVWDGDYGNKDPKPEINRHLLRLVDKSEEDWPCFIDNLSACFKETLEETLESELGKKSFNEWLREAQDDLGINKKEQALKNPAVIENVIEKAFANGKGSNTLAAIVDKIIALRNRHHPSVPAEPVNPDLAPYKEPAL